MSNLAEGQNAQFIEVEQNRAILCVEELSAFYDDVPVLRDINLQLKPDQVIAIIGPSGCGKSALLACLNRTFELRQNAHVQGLVCLNGQNIYTDSIDPTNIRGCSIGMILQKPIVVPFRSIRDEILFGVQVHQKLNIQEAEEFATKTQGNKSTRHTLLELASHTLLGRRRRIHALEDQLVESSLRQVGMWEELKPKLNVSTAILTPGQQQRLSIASIVALRPHVLLMDEPCSALDPKATAEVESMMTTIKKELPIIIVTHNLGQAKRASDRVIYLNVDERSCGQIIEEGPTAEIFTRPRHPLTEKYITLVPV
jgi:phosphate transport system ATP-binding protein